MLLAFAGYFRKDQVRLTEPVKELDIVLTQIAAAMPVDIMPGANDPANFTLPQQGVFHTRIGIRSFWTHVRIFTSVEIRRALYLAILTVEGKLVRAISILRLCDSGTAVMVNLRTLDYHLLTLSTALALDAHPES
ncbi:hypothetical protein SELMODRAFT_403984 [Selaginella moellendorffii]|uniref:DNA polymerase alpha/delta/epsilon subunit B domain-containing protein n=1 Tax=Selaginella moellendorffii TaxID=88036 RepID=D8QT72_SELML|nr:hypothetical protein SELMODRAFT_403984 [Selaginella moellendorffii]